MYKFCVAVFIALYLSAATGSFIGDTVEDLAYLAVKKALVQAGDTEFHADCAVKVWRATGTTKDVTEILFDGKMKIIDQLRQKARFADFICSPPGIVVAVLLFGCAFFLCCCCLIRCCMCRTKTPIVIQMPSTHSRTANVPYSKMDVA